jgi:hypothetical protein
VGGLAHFTPNGLVQRSRYADGTEVIVNTWPEPVPVPVPVGGQRIPGLGCLVNSRDPQRPGG